MLRTRYVASASFADQAAVICSCQGTTCGRYLYAVLLRRLRAPAVLAHQQSPRVERREQCVLPVRHRLPSSEPQALTPEVASLLTTLVDMLSYCVAVHGHKAQYYILSTPLAQKVCSLIYAREKTLRHCEFSAESVSLTAAAALRFIKACLRTGNHFIHRSFMKNGVTKAILDLVERETTRDTMLSSACLDTLELIRKV